MDSSLSNAYVAKTAMNDKPFVLITKKRPTLIRPIKIPYDLMLALQYDRM